MPTYAQISQRLNTIVTERDHEYAGIPMPLPGLGLVVEPKHPYAAKIAELDAIFNPPTPAAELTGADVDPYVGWKEVNRWHCPERGGDIMVLERPNGTRTWALDPDAPKRNRFIFGPFETMDAWNLDTELTAIDALASHLSERMYKSYILTGGILETSKRSGLSYIFRRLRPTIVLSPHKTRHDYFYDTPYDGDVHILTTLCLHPIAFYRNTFCGAMTPTDDVLAHLLLMRGDERLLWRRANQHAPHTPESGL